MKKEHQYYVYIMGSHRGVLYTGVTNSISRRVSEHKTGVGGTFTSKYSCNKLLYFEKHRYIFDAIAREKQIKKWNREKKINLIRSINPDAADLCRKMY
jgi:putative endonuclease